MKFRAALFAFSLLFLVVSGYAGSGVETATSSARQMGKTIRSQIWTKEQFRERFIRPLAPRGSVNTYMLTFNGTSFRVNPITCRYESAAVIVTVSETSAGEWVIKAELDENGDGSPDTALFTTPPADDLCSNGIAECSYPPGSSRICNYYIFAGSSLKAATSVGEMIDCECITNRCGAASLRANERGRLLEKVASGIAASFLNSNREYSVARVDIDEQNYRVVYSLSRTVCGNNTVAALYGNVEDIDDLSSYLENSAALQNRGTYVLTEQMASPSSLYSLATAQSNRTAELLPCRVERTVWFEPAYTYSSAPSGSISGPVGAGQCRITYWSPPGGDSAFDEFNYSFSVNTEDPAYYVLRCSTQDCALGVTVTISGCRFSVSVPPGCDCEVVDSKCRWDSDSKRNTLYISGSHNSAEDARKYYVFAGCEAGHEPSGGLSTNLSLGGTVYEYREDVSDGCSGAEARSDCELKEETIDGNVRVENYIPRYGEPQGSCVVDPDTPPAGYICRTVSVGSNGDAEVCCPWWVREREYTCEAKPLEFDFSEALQRAGVIVSSTEGVFQENLLNYSYSDLVGGSTPSYSGSSWLPGEGGCVMVCVVERTTVDTRTGSGGTASDYQIDNTGSVRRAWRICISDDSGSWVCPVEDGETVVEGCRCRKDVSPEMFGDAYSYMSRLLIFGGGDVECIGGGWKAQ